MAAKKSKSKSKLDYFDAFSQQADLAVKEADLLIEIIETFSDAAKLKEYLPKAHAIEHEADGINAQILSAAAVDFITPIEREDIVALSQALDDTIDNIEDVIQRFYMFDIQAVHSDAHKLAKLVRKGCNALVVAMGELRNFKKSKTFRHSIEKINDIEEEVDDMYIEVTRTLFTSGETDPMYVVVWMELFSRMERCTDYCKLVAETMNSILVKNS